MTQKKKVPPELGREVTVAETQALVELRQWVPVAALNESRKMLVAGLFQIEARLAAYGPTDATFMSLHSVRLSYIRELIREAEKGGDPLANRMAAYLDETQSTLSKKRELTRTVTMKETVEVEPAGGKE